MNPQQGPPPDERRPIVIPPQDPDRALLVGLPSALDRAPTTSPPWTTVAVILIFVGGAICASVLAHSESLAGVLAGAAAGIMVPGGLGLSAAAARGRVVAWLPLALALSGGLVGVLVVLR